MRTECPGHFIQVQDRSFEITSGNAGPAAQQMSSTFRSTVSATAGSAGLLSTRLTMYANWLKDGFLGSQAGTLLTLLGMLTCLEIQFRPLLLDSLQLRALHLRN